MKQKALFLFIGFLSISLLSFSQSNNGKPQKASINKGYYSIGNNSEKLDLAPANNDITVSRRGEYRNIQKGYYSIGNNREKLGRQIVIEGPGISGNRRTINKGYYSIGDHAETLKN
jgi:hypothetical protein